MKQKHEIEQNVTEALNSLDGLQRATPQPWFYTRLKARMQREEATPWVTIGSFLSRPLVAVAALCLVLVMNVSFLFYQSGNTVPVSSVLQSDSLIESESVIASSSSFDYENIAP